MIKNDKFLTSLKFDKPLLWFPLVDYFHLCGATFNLILKFTRTPILKVSTKLRQKRFIIKFTSLQTNLKTLLLYRINITIHQSTFSTTYDNTSLEKGELYKIPWKINHKQDSSDVYSLAQKWYLTGFKLKLIGAIFSARTNISC